MFSRLREMNLFNESRDCLTNKRIPSHSLREGERRETGWNGSISCLPHHPRQPSSSSCHSQRLRLIILPSSAPSDHGSDTARMQLQRRKSLRAKMTHWQTSCWIACCRCCVLTMALIFPAELDAQYGVTISTADSHVSILQREAPSEGLTRTGRDKRTCCCH